MAVMPLRELLFSLAMPEPGAVAPLAALVIWAGWLIMVLAAVWVIRRRQSRRLSGRGKPMRYRLAPIIALGTGVPILGWISYDWGAVCGLLGLGLATLLVHQLQHVALRPPAASPGPGNPPAPDMLLGDTLSGDNAPASALPRPVSIR